MAKKSFYIQKTVTKSVRSYSVFQPTFWPQGSYDNTSAPFLNQLVSRSSISFTFAKGFKALSQASERQTQLLVTHVVLLQPVVYTKTVQATAQPTPVTITKTKTATTTPTETPATPVETPTTPVETPTTPVETPTTPVETPTTPVETPTETPAAETESPPTQVSGGSVSGVSGSGS